MAVYNKGKLDYAAIAADAFGNAVGESVARSSGAPATQGVGPWSEGNYVNSMDAESDAYSDAIKWANNRSALNAANAASDASYYGPAWNGDKTWANAVSAGKAGSVTRQLNEHFRRRWADEQDSADIMRRMHAVLTDANPFAPPRSNASPDSSYRQARLEVVDESIRMANRAAADANTVWKWNMWSASATSKVHADMSAREYFAERYKGGSSMAASGRVADVPTMSVGERAIRNSYGHAQGYNLAMGYNAIGAALASVILTPVEVAYDIRNENYGTAALKTGLFAAMFIPGGGAAVQTLRGERAALLSEVNAEMQLGLRADFAAINVTPLGGTASLDRLAGGVGGAGNAATVVDRVHVLANIADNQAALASSNFRQFVRNEGQVQASLGIWPPNSGGYAPIYGTTLDAGTKLDRFGYPGGTFLSPLGASFESRALPPSYLDTKPYFQYEVVQPIPMVTEAKALPWFGQPGMGTQFQLPNPVQYYLENGYLKVIKQ
jgi:hypothetical protein